jgi:DNA-directed RNA polymerase subunit RPC12/RpoP
MPNDTFYIVNKLMPGENRGGDLCVLNQYWSWWRSIKPKPSNAILLGQNWKEIDTQDYDVAILIADAGQMNLLSYVEDMPRVFKFHLKNPGTKDSMQTLLRETGNYPLIFSADSQKEWYGNPPNSWVITGGKDPELYKGWIGDWERVLWVCERISVPGTVRWEERGGRLWTEVSEDLPSIRLGLDIDRATPLEAFENVILAFRHSRVFFEAAENTLLTDGLMEAMMTGMPIVAYPNNEMDRVIVHGINGFKSSDPKELKEYCKTLLKDEDLAKKMGAEARKTAMEVWNPKKTEEFHHLAFEEAMKVYNADKVPSVRIFHLDPPTQTNRTDLFFASTIDKRIQEREIEYHSELGWFNCPQCGETYRVIHKKGKHELELMKELGPKEKKLFFPQPRAPDMMKVNALEVELEPETDSYISSNPCPYCRSNQVVKVRNEVVCEGCRRNLGTYKEWRAKEKKHQ